MNTINAEEILIPLIKCRCRSFSRIFPAQTQSPIQTRSHLIQRVESVINNQTINLLRRCLMGDSLASQLYWTLYKQGELDDKTLIGRASHLMQNNELTFTKTIFNDIFLNTKSVLFEHIPHGRNGLIDTLRVIFNDYDTDNMNYARMLLRF